MWARVLGSAAGGGLPQWNCGCPNCAAARAGSPGVEPRTQSSVAVSADGRVWFLLNVSPDVRQQVQAFPALGPGPGQARGTAVGGCVLTDAELDHVAGLLLLREGGQFPVVSTAAVRAWLHQDFPVGPVLASFCERPWTEMAPDVPFELCSPQAGPSGLWVRAFEVSRHGPRYVRAGPAERPGAAVGLVIAGAGCGKLVYAPCVPGPGAWADAARGADAVLLDGTFWDDDELVRLGAGRRTARQMGHWPVGGPDGSLAWLADQPARWRVYVHVNNTNPMLSAFSPEWRQVEEAGARTAADGDVFHLVR